MIGSLKGNVGYLGHDYCLIETAGGVALSAPLYRGASGAACLGGGCEGAGAYGSARGRNFALWLFESGVL